MSFPLPRSAALPPAGIPAGPGMPPPMPLGIEIVLLQANVKLLYN